MTINYKIKSKIIIIILLQKLGIADEAIPNLSVLSILKVY